MSQAVPYVFPAASMPDCQFSVRPYREFVPLMLSLQRTALAILLLLMLLPAPARAETAAALCGGAELPCLVADGSYQVYRPARLAVTPSGKHPALLFFHGWQRTGLIVINAKDIQQLAEKYGLLIIAPNGRNRTWAHNGSPSSARDELAFTDSLLTDIEDRFEVDPDWIIAGGFSQGSSMVWDLICWRDASFRGFAAVSGAFWHPQPDHCPTTPGKPIRLVHFHGTSDTVVPMTGRPIGTGFHQGDVMQSIETIATSHQCAPAPIQQPASATLTCQVHQGCDAGGSVTLCLHPGGHLRPDGWFDHAAPVLGLTPLPAVKDD
jgi:polyhydroxybutyrate depolymerase